MISIWVWEEKLVNRRVVPQPARTFTISLTYSMAGR